MKPHKIHKTHAATEGFKNIKAATPAYKRITIRRCYFHCFLLCDIKLHDSYIEFSRS